MTWTMREPMTREELLALPITELAISTRARNCLLNIRMGLTIGELIELTAFDLMMRPGLGRVSLAEIEGILRNLRLKLAEGPPKLYPHLYAFLKHA